MEKKNTQLASDVVLPFPTAAERSSSGGYKSGRSIDRDTPETRSIWSTRSAGTTPPRISQLATTPCDLSPSARASAVCPPTASHAINNALLLMPHVTTQGGYYVNTVCDDGRAQNASPMSRRPRATASPFWLRLDEAIGQQFTDFNTNSLAKYLGIRQSAVYRWYEGPGLPELHRIADFARKGGVCVEWLINGTKPKHPISKDPTLRELFELCEQLDPQADGRQQVLRTARNELLAQTELQRQEAEQRKRRSGTG
jgi:hypothetical protein